MLKKASSLIPVPEVSFGDDDKIIMEKLDGPQVKDVLDARLAKIIGRQLGVLHKNNIIHGDLTTSNMIVVGDEVFFIDFGLSVTSLKDEDKAVDIHLFKQALESKHHALAQEAFVAFVKGYKETYPKESIFARLEQVEARGRHKNKH